MKQDEEAKTAAWSDIQTELAEDTRFNLPAKATPHYDTETDLDDLDAEDWEWLMHRSERGEL